jgi:hypothetical protein
VGPELCALSLVSITGELLEWKSRGSGSRKPRLMAAGTCCADHVTPSIRKVGTNSLTSGGGGSGGIVHLRAKATESYNRIHSEISHLLSEVNLSKYVEIVQHNTG